MIQPGADRATTNQIAQLAGVSVGSLYQYFGDKESIFEAVQERHSGAMEELLLSRLAAVWNEPIEAAVPVLLHAMVEAHRQNPPLHRALTEWAARRGRRRVLQIEARMAGPVARFVEARGLASGRDLETVVFILLRCVEALTHGAVIDRPSLLGEPLIREMKTLVLGYLSLREADSPL